MTNEKSLNGAAILLVEVQQRCDKLFRLPWIVLECWTVVSYSDRSPTAGSDCKTLDFVVLRLPLT